MAIAELTEEAFVAQEAATEGAGKVRVGVHDASRIEWSLSVPLPTDAPLDYCLRVEMQIPTNTFVRHTPWDQMQAFTRLDGPAVAAHGDVVSIDQLRRGALAMASQLARASDGFARHCRLAGSLFATAPHSELEDALTIWIEAAVRISQEARERLTRVPDLEAAELQRERALVDEYISDLANERQREKAQKRGSGHELLSLDAQSEEEHYLIEPAHAITPERLFEQRWAHAVLERVVTRLESEFSAAGHGKRFECLKTFLSDAPPGRSYADAATNLSLSVGAITSIIYRMRLRYRELFREEIARTVADPSDVDDEIRYLVAVLTP